MLISEMIDFTLLMEFDESTMRKSINDIILQARMNNVDEIKIEYIIGELNNQFTGMYFDNNDIEIRNKVSEIISANKWAEVDADTVYIKQPGDFVSPGQDPGKETAQKLKQQKDRVEKIAMSNVKKKSENGKT